MTGGGGGRARRWQVYSTCSLNPFEDEAVRIAWRESNHIATVENWCCLGLFQIYWNVHRGWLAGIGVTDRNQLFDARTNARAAYALYQRAGGWRPWQL